ncbi:hypothetical protein TNCV_3639161 [Trichonephila clavipes]|nr:hypothetical protein TNCV_3639161 [Trichonephila clavipes]
MAMSMQTKMQLNLEEREERPKHEPSRADLRSVLQSKILEVTLQTGSRILAWTLPFWFTPWRAHTLGANYFGWR